MSHPYSERFVVTDRVGEWTAWVVPAGKRAVVRCVTGYAPDGATIWVEIAQIATVVNMVLQPGATAGRIVDLRAVAYAGDAISVYIQSAAAAGCTVHGYLLDDQGGRDSYMDDGDPVHRDPPVGATENAA